jgi:hypothetical protein
MASIEQISKAIDIAKREGEYEVVLELAELLRQEVGKKGSGDAGFVENVLSGLGAGAVGMYESAALGGATLLEEEEELKARDKIKRVAESFRPEGGDKEALSYKLASGIGSIGALLPTAFLGPAALPVAGVIAGGAGAGEASERAREFGATEEERSAAALRGTAIGLTEIAPLGRIAKGLQIPGVQKVLDKLAPEDISGISSRVRSAAATGVTEGAQEAAAAILQNLNARGYDPEAELLNAGVLDEATIGGGAGAILQVFADTIAGRRGGRSVSTEGVEEVDDKSDEQAIEEVFGLPALPKTVDIPMPDGSLRENVPIDDPEAQAFLRAQKMQSEAETGQFKAEQGTAARRKTELEAVREAQGRDQGLASLVKDDAAEQARRQTGDLFPLEKATAEREAARVAARGPEGMTDAEVDDALAEQAAEEERVARLEDDDQIKEQPDMVARAEDEQIRDMEETAEIEAMLAEDEAQAARDAEEKRAIEQEYAVLFEGTLDVAEAEARDAAIATENRAALAQLEAQVKERKPKQTQQQQPLGGMQSRTSAKRQGVTRPATETGDESGLTTAVDTERGRDSVQDSPAVVAGRETPEGARDTAPTDVAGLDSPVEGTSPAGAGKGTKRGALARQKATAKAVAELKGISVKEAEQQVSGKQPDAQAKALLAQANIPVEGEAQSSVSPTVAQTVKKLTGKKLPTAKTDMQNKLEAVGFTPSSTAEAPAAKTAPPVRTINPDTNKFKFKDSDRFITPHKALDQDMQRLDTLAKTKFGPRRTDVDFTDAAIAGRTQAKAVGKYLDQFDTPADALINAVSEVSDPENKAYREPNEAKEKKPSGTLPTGKDPLAKNLAGTGGANAQAVLSWAKDNLSAETNAQLDSRLESAKTRIAKSEKTIDERGTKAAEAQLVEDRKTRQEQARNKKIEKASKGKVQVIPDRKKPKKKAEKVVEETPRAQRKLSKKEQELATVAEAVENVQGKAKTATKPPLTEDMSPAQVSARVAADTVNFLAGGGKIDILNLELDPKVTVEAMERLPKDVSALLKKGDLKGALQSLAKSAKSKRVKQIARALAENTGDTKIELANEAAIKDKGYDIGDRSDVAGLFDPKINTVILNSNMPLTIHALLHETTHAATINVLKNKSHPATKQLNKLYEDVKPYLDTAYGAKNLNEFVAEAFSNPDFQHKLASINPKGQDISALERFYRAVTNFVRRLIGMDTKPVGSALDSADAAILTMLSPNINTIDAPAMNMVSTQDGVRKIMDDMTDIQKRVSAGSKGSFIEGATDFLNSGVKGTAKEVLLKLTGSQALGDVARNNGFGQLGIKLHAKFEEQRGAIARADGKIEKVLEAYNKWAKKNVEQKQLLDNIIYSQEHGATIYQVDPTLTEAEAKKKYSGQTALDDRNLFEVWKANQEQWKKLNKGGRDQFTALRAEYKRMHEDLISVINREIDAIGDNTPSSTKAKIKKEMNERLLDSKTMDVYFPLIRQGNYKLSYSTRIADDNGNIREEPVFLMFETKGERDSALRTVQDDADTVEGTVESYNADTRKSSWKSAPAGSFVADVLDVISASGQDTDAKMQEQVMRLFIESLPETSFAKSLQKRKNTLGYIQDAGLGMQVKGYDLGAQIEKMRYGGDIRAIERAIDEVYDKGAPKGVNEDTFGMVRDEMLKRADFARRGAKNKDVEPYFQRANQTAFIYTIGFNASSALVNLSQIPLVVGPYLTSKFGAMESTAALGRASKFVGASKISIDEYYDIKEVSTTDANGVVTRDDVYTLKPSQEKKIRDTSVDKEKADAKIEHFNRMIPIVKMAKNRGQIHHSTIADQLGVNDVGRQKNKNRALRFLDGTSALSAVMFNAAERFNRQTTVVASYDLTLDKLDAMHEAKGDKKFYSASQAKFIDVPSSSEARMDLAAEEALYFAQETNGGSVLETAAGYSQQGIGRVALMYKSYGLQMYYTMLKSAKLASDNMFANDAEGKELRNMAFKQMLGIHMSALFFAGVQGLPLYGAVTMIADMFLDDEEDDARTITRKYLGEGWYKGAVTALTGTDVASRVSLSNLVLQENRFNKDPSLEESLGFYLGGPALSTGTRLKRAYDDLNSSEYGSFERGMESLMPAGITNLYRSTVGRYAREGGIQSRRKDPIYDDMTVGDFAAQSLGFPPAEYTYRQEISARNKGVEKAITSKRSMLTKKFYIAQRMGDHETMGEVLKDIIAHNNRHPTVAITPEQISKSVKSHMATSAKMHNGVTVNPLMQHAIMVSNMQYNKGY